MGTGFRRPDQHAASPQAPEPTAAPAAPGRYPQHCAPWGTPARCSLQLPPSQQGDTGAEHPGTLQTLPASASDAWWLQALPASPPGRPCTERLGHPGLPPLCHLLSCQDAPSTLGPETPVARAHFGSSSLIRALCAQPGAPWWPLARVVPPGCPPHESPETASACVCFSSRTVLSGCPHWEGPGTAA